MGAISKSSFMLLEYGYLVGNGCNYQNHHSCSWNVVIWSLMGAIINNIVHAPGIWLFGPKLVQLSTTLFMLLEYGYLVPNWCNYQNHCSRSWNMVTRSQMTAIIKNIVHALGIWLFGVKWVQSSKSSFVLLESGYLVPEDGCNYQKHRSCFWNMVIWSQMCAFIKIIIHAPGMWLFGP